MEVKSLDLGPFPSDVARSFPPERLIVPSWYIWEKGFLLQVTHDPLYDMNQPLGRRWRLNHNKMQKYKSSHRNTETEKNYPQQKATGPIKVVGLKKKKTTVNVCIWNAPAVSLCLPSLWRYLLPGFSVSSGLSPPWLTAFRFLTGE